MSAIKETENSELCQSNVSTTWYFMAEYIRSSEC